MEPIRINSRNRNRCFHCGISGVNDSAGRSGWIQKFSKCSMIKCCFHCINRCYPEPMWGFCPRITIRKRAENASRSANRTSGHALRKTTHCSHCFIRQHTFIKWKSKSGWMYSAKFSLNNYLTCAFNSSNNFNWGFCCEAADFVFIHTFKFNFTDHRCSDKPICGITDRRILNLCLLFIRRITQLA